ncbi:hypothetical protein T11_2162 [Trichinella zimbabwensis]|uniref:Uncharacterized protein n=1 Tax=Trichinella zimbabwensis TaxID=268475 RepID=A0A0V1H7I1_9BILA|nr:hypothetical protein T11_2162 [Trichinella zimbabwensis]
MKKLKSGINELCEMANMPGVGLEIFKAGGGWRDQNGPHLVACSSLPLDKGEVELFPCSLDRKSAGFWIMKRGKPILTAKKRKIKKSFGCGGDPPAWHSGPLVPHHCPTAWSSGFSASNASCLTVRFLLEISTQGE